MADIVVRERSFRKTRAKRGRRLRKGKRAGLWRKRPKYVRLGLAHFRILYWNCASVRQRGPILDGLAFKADLVALQETRLTEGEFRLTGFHCFYNRRHLGMAILVRDSILVSEVDVSRWDCEEIQLQAVKIQSERPFVLVNVYACTAKVDAQKWQCFSEILLEERHVIFCGDFNAKGRTWGNVSTNTQGEGLESTLGTIDLVCINSGCVTRIASQHGDHKFYAVAEKSKDILIALGFPQFTLEDFYDTFIDIVKQVESPGTAEKLLETFNDQGLSDYFVVYLRLLVSGHLQANEDSYIHFIDGERTVGQFCSQEVEPMGKESDHIHIVALTKALDVPVCVEYMDREGHTCNSFIFNPSNSPDAEIATPIITMLYRPGHYDILYPL